MTDRRDEITAEVNAKIDSLKWIKLVGVGNVATGKTCLIKYFCENRFAPGYQPTVGVDYGFKIETVTNEEVRVHLWDLSGSDDYYETRIELYHKTDGVFLVYDVTNANSFDAINQWLEEVNKSCSPKPIMVLCACKVDQKQKRVVTKEKGEEWARQNKMGYFEVSAATGDNVIKMYDSLIASILSKR